MQVRADRFLWRRHLRRARGRPSRLTLKLGWLLTRSTAKSRGLAPSLSSLVSYSPSRTTSLLLREESAVRGRPVALRRGVIHGCSLAAGHCHWTVTASGQWSVVESQWEISGEQQIFGRLDGEQGYRPAPDRRHYQCNAERYPIPNGRCQAPVGIGLSRSDIRELSAAHNWWLTPQGQCQWRVVCRRWLVASGQTVVAS